MKSDKHFRGILINPKTIATITALVLAATSQVYAQYAPPPAPAPFAGFLNAYLREENTNLTALDLGGNLRLRYEDKDGFAIPGAAGSMDFRANGADVENHYLLTQLRFHAGYTDEWWSAYAEGQSSFAGGDNRWAYFAAPAPAGTVTKQDDGPESDTLDLHQAFVTLGNLKKFPLSLKLGRQEMSYGDERLIGAFGWNNIGRTFDAAKLRLQTEWFAADFFTSRPVIPEDGRFDVDNDYDWFSGAYVSTTEIPKTLLETYLLARNSSPQAIAAEPSPQFPQPSARDIYTAGGRLKNKAGEFGNWDYTVEGAYQFGDFRDTRVGAPTTRLRQDSFMAVVQGGYTFSNLWAAPRLALEYSYSSGDSNPTDDTHGTFDNLFPTTHKFFGYMNFFSLQNIQDARGILQFKPASRMNIALEGHGFWLADTHDSLYNATFAPRGGATLASNVGTGTGYGLNPNYSSFVGTELDLIVGVAVTRFAQVEAGFGHFFVGNYIQQSLSAPGFGSKDANWLYAQTTINF